jgi:CRISPR-associated protein (TIGR02584 family)
MSSTLTNGSPSKEPGNYSKRVLLAVCGLSPQIVTETVYALVRQSPAYIPTDIYLITTEDGARKAVETLLSPGKGWLNKLVQDYQIPAIEFDQSRIHILQTPEGVNLSDIRTPTDNQYAADFITDVVRQHTLDPDCALHVSIAGGRKTMGFYLGYALSLYGRDQDRLSHVLVQEPFENCPDFFYPTPYSQRLKLRDQQEHDAQYAEVALAQIPFVSLRHGLPQALLDGQASFNDTVRSARASLAGHQLDIDLRSRRIRASGIVIELPPAELAFLSVFAKRAQAGESPLSAPCKGVPDLEWAKRYLDEYRRIVGTLSDIEATERSLRHGMEDGYFSQRKSRLEKTLKAKLQSASVHYLIHNGNVRPGRFRLMLPPQSIRYGDL